MTAYVLVCVVFLVCACVDLTQQSEHAPWTYSDEGNWPGKCQKGQQQSPINIVTKDAVEDYFGDHIKSPLVYRGYSAVDIVAFNTGHTLQWDSVPGSTPPVLSGGPLDGNYTFLQFHLHWLSEHAVDGVKYPLEIHFVHVKTGLSVEEAVKRPDGLAVLGILAEVSAGDRSDAAFEDIMPSIPNLLSVSKDIPNVADIIDITKMFSPDPQSFYTYQGSLTTPTCDEAVTWIVMEKPITISDDQYRTISQVDVGGIANFRSVQPTNRMVYRTVASCATNIVPGFASVITALAYCSSAILIEYLKKGYCLVYNTKNKWFGVKYSCSGMEKVSSEY